MPKRHECLKSLQPFPTLVLFCASIYAFYRCGFGVDLTDEAQYVGQAYTPLIGGAAFQSDLFIQQTVSLMLTPLVWIFTHLAGSSNGIVLFFRLVWWASATLTAVVIFQRIKKELLPLHAALIASTLIVFVPFNIPSPSYNSFGILFLVLGLCTQSILSTYQLIFLSLAMFAYPPFGIALLGVFSVALLDSKNRNAVLKKLVLLIGSGICVGIFSILVFKPSALRDAFMFSSSFGTFGTQEKLATWKAQLNYVLFSPNQPIAFAFVGVTFFILNFFRKLRTYLLVPIMLISIPILRVEYLPHHYWIILIAIICLPISLMKQGWLSRSSVILAILCGLISGWASSNGLPNAAIGIFPAFLAALMGWSKATEGRSQQWLVTGALGLLLIGFALKNFDYVYRDDPIASLTELVKWGPYQGLRTTPLRAEFLDKIQRDVLKLDGETSSVLFFYSFPAGYLMSTMRPATRMLYLHDREYPDAIKKYLLPTNDTNRPDYVIRLKNLPGWYLSEGDSSLNTFFSPAYGYNLIVDQPDYYILKKGT